MEQDLESPVAGKTEERSGSVLLTYFHGDISSMVDEHFSRALSKAANQKGEHSKSRRKSAQDGLDSSQWKAQSQSGFHSRHSIYPPERLQLGTSREPHSNPHHPTDSAIFWPGGSRQGMTMALPPMVYPPAASTDGLMMAEHQYTNSLLNIIHNDRPNHSSTVVVSHPKQDHIPEWTKYPGFGDQRSSDVNHDPGVQMKDKKDFYWY